jgi:hypothetical protein
MPWNMLTLRTLSNQHFKSSSNFVSCLQSSSAEALAWEASQTPASLPGLFKKSELKIWRKYTEY